GLLTEHALKRFQSAHQIDITGTVDEQTMITLIDNEIKNKLKKIQPLINNMTDNSPTKDIVNVQEVLQDIGYYKGKIDGIYGPLTADAIQQVKIEYMSPPPSPQSKVEENIVTNNANQTVKKADENKQSIKPVQTNSGQLNHTQVIQTAKTY